VNGLVVHKMRKLQAAEEGKWFAAIVDLWHYIYLILCKGLPT
jgi:hypothetical protein